jgi:hypothetical protein
MPPELSIFKNALTATPFEVRASVPTLIDRIRGSKYQPQTSHLRSLTNETDRKDYKKTAFIAVTWSGTFAPTRAKMNLQAHSGLICIDLDKLTADRLAGLSGQLQADEFTHVLFVSPSGSGLKVVIKIDYQHPEDHEAFFRQIRDYYRDCYGVTDAEFDESGKNVDRLCFLPADPEAYHNSDSRLMPLAEEYETKPNAAHPEIFSSERASDLPTKPTKGYEGAFVGFVGSSSTRFHYLDRCLNIIQDASDGGKHTALCKAAYLAGGFVASGLLDENEAVSALENAIRAKPNVADFEAARRTIRTQIAEGKTKPVSADTPTYSSRPFGRLPRVEGDKWPAPVPIKTDLLPVLPMEPDMIPEALRSWLTDIADRMRCPLDFTAASAVVMLSALIGTRLTIKPKGLDDWTIVPNLWGGVIGEPSMLKTPSVSETLKPLTRMVAQAREEQEQELQRYSAEQATYEAQKKVYQSQEQDRLKGKKVANPVGYPEAPDKPTERRFMTSDATVEKLGELLNENPNGLLQFRDELTGLLASWDRAGHEQDRAFYLEAWNGYNGMTIDRIGRGTMHVKTVCVSLFGGIQPAKLLGYLQAATGFDNDGFVQRLQVAVYPDKPTWTYTDEQPDKIARDRAFTLIQQVAESDLSTLGYEADEYNRFAYTRFDADAQAIFKHWFTEWETDVLPAESGLLLEHFTKYRSLMPSLALVFHVVNCTDEGRLVKAVSVEAATMAVRWCAYLMSHARRIYGLLDTVSVEGAARILSEIKRGRVADGFKAREIVQKGWANLKSTEQVETAIGELLARHWIREEQQQQTGGRPEAPRYLLHPNLMPNA